MKLFKRGKQKPSFKVTKPNWVNLKDFAKSLKALFIRKKYLTAAVPMAGMFIIWLALSAIGLYFAYTLLASLSMSVMMIMYGMMTVSSLLFAILEFLGLLFLVLVLGFLFYALQVGLRYAYLARIEKEDKKVTATVIWNRFKHLRKNQLLRLCLYVSLFIFLWRLPLMIIGDIWSSNKIVAYTTMIGNYLILIWKSLQYSQAIYLYREKQPQFLGQSMRHALTASKRFMAGFKLNYLVVYLLFEVLPVAIWSALTGGLVYYGIYTATNPLIWIGAVLLVLGLGALVPYCSMVSALYFHETSKKVKVENMYADTFKPVEQLTGEAYDD